MFLSPAGYSSNKFVGYPGSQSLEKLNDASNQTRLHCHTALCVCACTSIFSWFQAHGNFFLPINQASVTSVLLNKEGDRESLLLPSLLPRRATPTSESSPESLAGGVGV